VSSTEGMAKDRKIRGSSGSSKRIESADASGVTDGEGSWDLTESSSALNETLQGIAGGSNGAHAADLMDRLEVFALFLK
jgi:hypothetical protein